VNPSKKFALFVIISSQLRTNIRSRTKIFRLIKFAPQWSQQEITKEKNELRELKKNGNENKNNWIMNKREKERTLYNSKRR
jgi:hypothetical protein